MWYYYSVGLVELEGNFAIQKSNKAGKFFSAEELEKMG